MKSDFIHELSLLIQEHNFISKDIYDKLDVKRGLRNKNGTGVLVGLTKIGAVVGYSVEDGKKIPKEGQLYFRGIPLKTLIEKFKEKGNRYAFEKTMFLLLFGKVPENFELKMFLSTLKELQDKSFKVITTDLKAEKSIYDINYNRTIVVIGNEANGVSQEVLEIADERVIIPMLGKTESLNASIAASIMIYEYVRQKIQK